MEVKMVPRLAVVAVPMEVISSGRGGPFGNKKKGKGRGIFRRDRQIGRASCRERVLNLV